MGVYPPTPAGFSHEKHVARLSLKTRHPDQCVGPAVIQTAFLDAQPAEVISYMTAKIPMRRTGTILECAQLLAWMVSPGMPFHHRVHLRPLRRPGNLLSQTAERTNEKEQRWLNSIHPRRKSRCRKCC